MIDHKTTPHRRARLARHAARAGLGLVCLLLWSLAAPAQAQEASLQQAVTVYNEGDYAQAADLFAALGRDESTDKTVRKQALQWLGRAYIARNRIDDARQAVLDLLDLQPPLIELNPDTEPPPLMNLYYEARHEIENAYTVPKLHPGMRTVAVMDFRNYALDEAERWDRMQWGFSSAMILHLRGAVDLKLVDRENLQWILGELDLQKDPARVDQETAVQVGKVLGAHAMVFGGIYLVGEKMRLEARVVKVETSEILWGDYVEGKPDDFFALLERLSLKVAASLSSDLSEEEVETRTGTRNLDAMMAYSEGLELLEKSDYQAAHARFLRALELDPNYEPARLKAESLRPMLAAVAAGAVDTGGGF